MTSPLTLRRLWRIFGVRLHRSERLWPTSKSSPIPSEGATIRGNRFAFRSEYLFWDYDRSGLCVSGSVRSSTGLEIGMKHRIINPHDRPYWEGARLVETWPSD